MVKGFLVWAFDWMVANAERRRRIFFIAAVLNILGVKIVRHITNILP